MAEAQKGSGSDDDRKKRRPGLLLWRGALWGNRANSGYGWLGWLLGGKIGTGIGVATLGGLVGLTAIGASQPDYLPGVLGLDKKVPVVTQRWDNSVVFPIDGMDKSGKHATFDVLIKTKDITWVRGSGDQIAAAGQTIADGGLQAALFGPQVLSGLAASNDVIAVGLASEEGPEPGEAVRAERRGRTAATWLDRGVGSGKHIWALNLGQFRAACSGVKEKDTSWERPFLMIGVRAQDAGVNLKEALADAMTGKTNLPSTDCYSRFDLAKLH